MDNVVNVSDAHTNQPIFSIIPEKFIPVDAAHVVERAVATLFEAHQRTLGMEVLRLIISLRQISAMKAVRELSQDYEEFNPDNETINLIELAPAEQKMRLKAFKEKIEDLVISANYNEIDKAALELILEKDISQEFSAEVDLDDYDFCLILYRGAIRDIGLKRNWKRLWLTEVPKEIDAYRRLFVGLKLKPFSERVQQLVYQKGMSQHQAERHIRRARTNELLAGISEHAIRLEIFRRIPRKDLYLLFPNARIRLNFLGKIWLWMTSAWIVSVAVITTALKLIGILYLNLYIVAIVSITAFVAFVKLFFNLRNMRTRNSLKYFKSIAKLATYHKISINQSVLSVLSDDGEEEDIKEAALTYAILLRHGYRGLDAVKYEAERFLKDQFDVDCAFDIEDGCSHLRGLGLLVEDDTGVLRIRDLEDAREHLSAQWGAVIL
jgi:hypothetical protein